MMNIDPPIFLVREAAGTSARVPPLRKRRWVLPQLPFAKRPPKSFAGAERVWLSLGDEAPAIGSGRRHVWAKVGWKWVRLCDSMGHRAKVKREVFDKVLI